MNTTSQKEQNDAVLSNVRTLCVQRRIKRELDKMYPLYNEILVSVTPESKLQVTVRNADAGGFSQKYDFIICENYPFNSPQIFYQGRKYWEFLRSNHENIKLMKQITGSDCLCCSSYHCKDNWGPGVTLIHIIDEICRIKQLKRNVINKLLADKIKACFLVADIDLDSWLF
jgi:hypothetical protein